MAVVIALDAGTTGARAVALDEAGRTVVWAYREFPQHYPRPGWVEHDPDAIWDAAADSLAEVVEALDQPVAAVGLTNQRETVVAWSRSSGRPLTRAVVWQDRRTAERCRSLEEAGHLPLVRERTGLVLDPYFSATKLAWWFDNGVVEDSDDLALGTVDSWLVWKLTGGAEHVTDPSNASRTLLYDLHDGGWSGELGELFGVPIARLPTVRPSAGALGRTAAGASALPAGVAIAGVAGDQQAALFGQACFAEGDAKNTYGTGSFVLMNVGSTCPPPADALLTSVGWELPDQPTTYVLEGAIFVTGAAIQWLRDGLGVIERAAETGPLAAGVPDSGGVYLVPAFTGLGSPWWEPDARGAIVGLTLGTERAHLARAVVEAMAYQTRDVVDAMTASSGRPLRSLRADGGASVMDVLLQFQADQLGVAVVRPVETETTARGAAFLAGLGAGVWASTDELAELWVAERVFRPSADRAAADAAHAGWRRAVDATLHLAASERADLDDRLLSG